MIIEGVKKKKVFCQNKCNILMKKILILLFIVFETYSCFASQDSSIKTIEYDSLSKRVNVSKSKKGIDFIVFGGLGMATGSTWGDWESFFNNGMACDFGLEVPFTQEENYISLEILSHGWITKYKF